jgi:hypothetical protein
MESRWNFVGAHIARFFSEIVFRRYTFGFGAGRSRAIHSDAKPACLWPPSQNGLLPDNPQRQSDITLRPPRPYVLPLVS